MRHGFLKQIVVCAIAMGIGALAYSQTTRAQRQGLGYIGTPLIPGTPYHVHDGDRPQPRVVTPGATFSDGSPAPSDATVLFDGKDLSQWQDDRGGPANWLVENGYMQVRRGGIRTKGKWADFQLHLEWCEPTPATGEGQERGNSGILINNMYEIQVLDSFQAPTYPDGQCGALYGQTPPLVNACRPPGQWETYDILWESPRWDDKGTLVKKANVTVIQNGVMLHNKREYFGGTDGINGIPHPSLGKYGDPHPPEVFIELQDHNNPVRYKNLWVRPVGEYDKP
jgi:hypothetical protein